jgi:cell division protein DivIC
MSVAKSSIKTKFNERQGIYKYLWYFKNKYLLTFTLFTLYALFLDDEDMFTLISQNSKLNKIKADQELIDQKLIKTTTTLKKLNYISELERYAREEKLFKKDNEDIFIIYTE